MKKHSFIVLSSLVLLHTLGCQPAPVSTPPQTTQPAVVVPAVLPVTPSSAAVISLGARNGGTISLSLQQPGGLRVQDLPKTLRDVEHFTATLWHVAPDALAPAQLVGASASLNRGNNYKVTFADVPIGTYQMRVSAMATADESTNITKLTGGNAYMLSTNTATIAGSTATYSDGGTTLSAVVPLLDGNANNLVAGPIDVTIPAAGAGSRALALTGATHTGVAIVNNGSKRATAFPVDTSNLFQLTNIQQGAHNDAIAGTGGPTHEIWAFAVDSVGLKGTPAFPTSTAVSATGVITGPIAVSMRVPALTTASSISTTGRLAVDSSNVVYWFDGTDIRKSTAGVFSIAQTAPGAITNLAVNGAGDRFWSIGTAISVARGVSTPVAAVTAPNTPAFLTVDEEDAIYWYDATAGGNIYRSVNNGLGWQTPVIAVPATGAVTGLSVDAYGNIYIATAANIQKATLDLAGVSYGAATQMMALANITSLSVDRAGNAYVTVTGTNKIQMISAAPFPATTSYTIAGNGTATPLDAIGQTIPTSEPLQAPARVAVSKTGRVFFTSNGTSGTSDFLRQIF